MIEAGHEQWIEMIAWLYANHPAMLRLNAFDRPNGRWPTDDGLRRYRDGLMWMSAPEYGGDPRVGEAMYLIDEYNDNDYEPAL